MSKKILVLGNSAKEHALAKLLSQDNEVYLAPGSATMKEFATCIDIREDSVFELLDFVLENEIDLTIPFSRKSLDTNIVELFTKNNIQIFAPSKNICSMIFNKSILKKIFYKLRIPTPKFGIFEKTNMVNDYIKNINIPFVLKTNDDSSAVVLTSKSVAKSVIESVFSQNNQKIIVEDYVYGSSFTYYVITDGYKALPIGSSLLYKYSLDGDGGQLTSGMGACSPNYKLSDNNEYYLMENVIYPLLEYFDSENSPYLGILGVNCILSDDGSVQVLGLQPFVNNCDAQAVLQHIDTDIIALMESCVFGSFSDEIDIVPQKDFYTTSLVLTCNNRNTFQNVITGLDMIDSDIVFYPSVVKNKYLEYEASYGEVLVLSSTARTVTNATSNLYQDVKNIDFKGLYYRRDICKFIET